MARDDSQSPSRSQPHTANLGTRRDQRETSHSRPTESWIEVSSRSTSPSQSSTTDEIVTTGLRVRANPPARRKRTGPAALRSRMVDRASSAAGSSQDEYEESESESDRVMTSSNEGLPTYHLENGQAPYARSQEQVAAEEDDEDERRTTLGILPNEQSFTPQPNAFSHPPSSHSLRQISTSSDNYFPPATRPSIHGPAGHRHSFPARAPQHSPMSGISHSHGVDHDAALRASLTTLLSCAAAARGLPKRNNLGHPVRTHATSRIEPSTLRLVPESVILGEEEDTAADETAHRRINTPLQPRPVTRRISSSSNSPSDDSAAAAVSLNAHATSSTDKAKHRNSRSSSKERRAKKQRHTAQAAITDDMNITPTLFTWVLSAGVLVVFSALSFSAGFALGRETGRVEGAEAALELLSEAEGAGMDVAACGRELLRGSVGGLGLRRLRFASPVGVVH